MARSGVSQGGSRTLGEGSLRKPESLAARTRSGWTGMGPGAGAGGHPGGLPAQGPRTAPLITAYLGKLGLCETPDNNRSGFLGDKST